MLCGVFIRSFIIGLPATLQELRPSENLAYAEFVLNTRRRDKAEPKMEKIQLGNLRARNICLENLRYVKKVVHKVTESMDDLVRANIRDDGREIRFSYQSAEEYLTGPLMLIHILCLCCFMLVACLVNVRGSFPGCVHELAWWRNNSENKRQNLPYIVTRNEGS